jgi:hypothetical protein
VWQSAENVLQRAALILGLSFLVCVRALFSFSCGCQHGALMHSAVLPELAVVLLQGQIFLMCEGAGQPLHVALFALALKQFLSSNMLACSRCSSSFCCRLNWCILALVCSVCMTGGFAGTASMTEDGFSVMVSADDSHGWQGWCSVDSRSVPP